MDEGKSLERLTEGAKRSEEGQAGIDSVETGVRLLLALSRLGGPQTLTAIAAASGLAPPRVHRYLVSLVRSGMVERHPARGYQLGPAALEVGVSALSSMDALQLATEGMVQLCDELNQAVALMVWGRDGPVILRAEDSNRPISLRLRLGQPLPVTTSASGIVLAAHLPWSAVRDIVEREVECAVIHSGGEPRSVEQVRRALAEARRRGMSRIVGTLTPGIAALAAPVFDATGKVVLSLSVVAPSAGFDVGWSSEAAVALKHTCGCVSARLGFREPAMAPSGAGRPLAQR